MGIKSLFIVFLILSMGIGSFWDHESKFIYTIGENYEMKDNTYYYATFQRKPKDEGSFRYCFIGEIKNKNGDNSNPYMFPSGKCVVKVFKDGHAYSRSEVINEVDNVRYSQKVSNIFNSKYGEYSKKLFFNDIYLSLFDENAFINVNFFYSKKRDFQEDEYLIVEPYIDGKYEKFVNNAGWQKKNMGRTIPFFMHWNWVYSEGEKLVTDIQGVEKNNFYELTDPAVQSVNQEYGNTDLGILGLVKFLINHKHNELCEQLTWPDDEKIEKLEALLNAYRPKYDKEKDIEKLYLEIIKSTFDSSDDEIIIILIFVFLIIIIICIICICMCKRNNNNEQQFNRYNNEELEGLLV